MQLEVHKYHQPRRSISSFQTREWSPQPKQNRDAATQQKAADTPRQPSPQRYPTSDLSSGQHKAFLPPPPRKLQTAKVCLFSCPDEIQTPRARTFTVNLKPRSHMYRMQIPSTTRILILTRASSVNRHRDDTHSASGPIAHGQHNTSHRPSSFQFYRLPAPQNRKKKPRPATDTDRNLKRGSEARMKVTRKGKAKKKKSHKSVVDLVHFCLSGFRPPTHEQREISEKGGKEGKNDKAKDRDRNKIRPAARKMLGFSGSWDPLRGKYLGRRQTRSAKNTSVEADSLREKHQVFLVKLRLQTRSPREYLGGAFLGRRPSNFCRLRGVVLWDSN
ncbi:hypothetical protein C8R47DRAFT_1248766 [Mycena vitilis]|nr:hypothetical protein C8R47DRAFT_1248766 [Mycena vitilis]